MRSVSPEKPFALRLRIVIARLGRGAGDAAIHSDRSRPSSPGFAPRGLDHRKHKLKTCAAGRAPAAHAGWSQVRRPLEPWPRGLAARDTVSFSVSKEPRNWQNYPGALQATKGMERAR
jgi:hypothetical protein